MRIEIPATVVEAGTEEEYILAYRSGYRSVIGAHDVYTDRSNWPEAFDAGAQAAYVERYQERSKKRSPKL
jgi:hypothetical protein